MMKKHSFCEESIVAIGNFDGLHLGHQFLLDNLIHYSKLYHLVPLVYTFNILAKNFFLKENIIEELNTLKEKKEKIGAYNIKTYVQEFTHLFASNTALEFIEKFLVNKFNAKCVLLGYNHSFGSDKLSSKQLEELLFKKNIKTKIISPFYFKGQKISSTIIRTLIKQGKIEEANNLLGYNFFIESKVIKGHQIGSKINYPTANLDLKNYNKIIPKKGVYLVKVFIEKSIQKIGMLNVGINPTTSINNLLKMEVHILNYNANLYNKFIKIEFLEYLREEIKFKNLEALKLQLNKDINLSLNKEKNY